MHHIGVATGDLKASMIAYKNMGYFQISNIICDHFRNVNIVLMEQMKSKITVELIEPINAESPVSSMLKKQKNYALPYHICYLVQSIDSTVNELKKHGFIKVDECTPAIALDNRSVVFMLNQKVGMIELLEEK